MRFVFRHSRVDVQHVSHKFISKKLDFGKDEILSTKVGQCHLPVAKNQIYQILSKNPCTWKNKRHWEDQIQTCEIMEIASGHLLLTLSSRKKRGIKWNWMGKVWSQCNGLLWKLLPQDAAGSRTWWTSQGRLGTVREKECCEDGYYRNWNTSDSGSPWTTHDFKDFC